MFRWAVCGLGKISHRWVKVANSLPNMKVVCAVSKSKNRAEIYRKTYDMDYAFTYEELVENKECIDAVYVSTHMSEHKHIVEMFLKAKIPVLCEKSFAVNSIQAQSMIRCARENNVLLMEAMWCRFLPATRYVEQLVKEKKYGDIIHLSGDFKAGWGHGHNSRVWRHDVGGGSVLDLAVYLVHYAYMLLGKPKQVIATGKVRHDVDIYSDFIFEYKKNIRCDLHSSLQFPKLREAFHIYMKKGIIIIPSFYGAKKVIEIPQVGKRKIVRFPKIDGFSYEILHFVELENSNKKESPIVPLSVTLDVMELLDEINKQIGVSFNDLN